ncbi:hypothetical protein AXF42_Ash001697 [Apostasia shenzhenica]|uniref:Uncharacterized protein n=1 Tax=Apostasia shenzhenica TaxID=1088818 RepID=A0A2I0AB27_9ASPA|nr:hypothetical protein AXF42_Ash001697 [Apostasia shenzhenica]
MRAMGMSSPKSNSGAMAVPRSVSSIAVMVGGLAIFLLVASALLVSYPVSSSFQDYFLGVNRVERPSPPSWASVSENHSDFFISVPTSLKEAQKDLVFKGNTASTSGFESGNLANPLKGKAWGEAEDDSVPSNECVKKYDADFSPEASKESLIESASGNCNGSSSSSDANLVAPNPQTSSMTSSARCDLYNGKWVNHSEGPLYTNSSCPVITQMQNCRGNGRPDTDYENWRWKPDQCDLPKFNGRKFLELMRGKTLAFVGDSVARNHMESLLCILWQVEVPKNRGNRRLHRWYFRSTSTMIVRIWSSWLVHKAQEPMEFAPEGIAKVHLDLPDEGFMEFLPGFDVVVLSSGHWFAKQSVYVLNRTIVGGQLWKPHENANVDMKINNIDAFGISVETAIVAIAAHPNFTGLAIVRSYSPDHYEGGEWNTGGSCTGKVSPVSKVVRNGFTDVMHEKQVTGFQRAVEKAGNKSTKLILMDITEVFGYRPDGHPGPFRSPDPNKKTKRGPNGEPPPQDCLHWCMPGPIDTWNELLLEIIRRDFEAA